MNSQTVRTCRRLRSDAKLHGLFALVLGLGLLCGPRLFADAVQYRSGVQAEPSLLSFYPFDGDVSPTAVDRISPLQNGTLNGAVFSSAVGTVGAQSAQGARVALGAVTDYEFSDGSGTVEMFLYQTATAGFNPCFFAGRDDSQSPAVRYSLHGGTGGNQLFIWNGSVAPSVTTPVSMLNTLVHVAYVFDAGLVTVYFNGSVIATWNAPLGAGVGRSFQIGASGSASQEAWPGRIDEVAIYGEALPASAIAAHYATWLTAAAGTSPVITQQPTNLALDDGQPANFSVQLADATGAVYRWTRNGASIPGATNASYTIPAVTLADNNSTFRCVIYNPYGGTNSATALLAVRTPPSFVVAPVDTVRYITQPGALTAVVNGSLPLSYQWFKDSALMPNATNASLNFAALDPTNSGAYVLTVTNVFGAITSAPALLSVVPVLVVTPPKNAARFVGQPVTFSVTAAGVAPLAYQWFKGASPLAGETNTTFTIPSVSLADGASYSVRVTNSFGATNTPGALLTVLDVTTPQVVQSPPPFEWLPQDNGVSADAVVLFNEVMYHPGPGQSPALQWIELQNVMRADVDLSNWRLDGGVHFTFPSNTIVPGGAFVLIAGDVNVFTNATGIASVFGPFQTNLSNGGEKLILRNHDGRMMDELTYGDEQPWPEGADGSGATLSKRTPLSASAEPINWAASARRGGTPGAANFPTVTTPELALNELDAATNATFRVELFNRGTSSLALANFTLATTATNGATNFALPAGTLSPGAFAVFDSAQTGFTPAQNDKVFLLTSNTTVLVDAAAVKNQLRGRSPDGFGRWLRPTATSFGASNVVLINRDIVLNEILYEAAPSYPSNIYAGSDEQWIELFNRGTNPVSLAGWSLDNAVRYNFPTNAQLAPGAYLVVAKNAAAMQAAHPGVTVLGNFSGSLRKSTDLIELKDASQRVVAEVRYYSSGRWPSLAAGGGSSLELIDPYADARRAESWAASDESGKTAWETITYRGVAQTNKGYSIGYNIWNEFVLGLLEAGDLLIDDVSVTEFSAGGLTKQLIQNGSFQGDTVGSSPAFWRMQGTHGQNGRTRVELDPTNPNNKVLRISASGPTDWLQNHVETTFKNNGTNIAVVPGREYEISYRAKWLGGSRLLNTRLYLKWLQRTTVLAVPSSGGTPGAINSRRVASAGPTYAALSHSPVVPNAGVPVTVSVNAYDPQNIASLTLNWRVDGGAWNSTPMSLNAQPPTFNQYRGTIPGQAAGTKIQFCVEGRDALGGVSTFPADGTNSRAMFIFNDGLAAAAPHFNFRFVMTAADTATMYFNTNRMSNDRLGATITYNESEVFYDVGVRLKGSAFGRNNDTETGLSIDFDPDHKFRGAHDSISIERGGSKRELLAKHLFNQAGQGVVAGYDDVAHIVTPRAQDVGRCFLSMTRTTDTLLDTQYGSGGTVYNLELLYTPTGTVNGNAEAPKLNFPYSHNNGAPDLQDLGDDKEFYRWNFQVRNNRAKDDFSLMMAAAKSFELNGAAMDTRTRQFMDVDQWLRCWAMMSLVGNDDTYTRLYNHNFRMYQRPDDNRLVALSWDLDRAFNLGTSASLWGNAPDGFGGTNRMRKMIEHPANLRIYYNHLLDLISRCYNSPYATPWASHYATLIGDGGLNSYPAYIASRAAFVQSQIPAAPAFNITTSNGLAFAVSSNFVTLSGTAPYGVRFIRVNGERFIPTWPTVSAWTMQLALLSGTNSLVLEGVDVNGNLIAGATDTISITVNTSPDEPLNKVVINEIMFQPAVPDAEYVELFNTSFTTAFDLRGWRLNGTGLTFSNATVIPPRGFLVVAASRIAFATAYGSAVTVAAEFPGALQDDGETITLIKQGVTPAQDQIIDRVRYEGGLPWPVAAQGTGSSLQLIDASQERARAGNWFASYIPPVISPEVATPEAVRDGWRFFSASGSIGGGEGGSNAAMRLLLYLGEAGSAIIDDLSIVAGTNAGVGPTNYVHNGNFEAPLVIGTANTNILYPTNAWFLGTNYTNSLIVGDLVHAGAGAFKIVGGTAGSATPPSYNRTMQQFLFPPPAVNSTNTLSFWYWATNSATNLYIRIRNSAFLTTSTNSGPTNINIFLTPSNYVPPLLVSPATNSLTPGAANQNATNLPAFAPLWINEVQADQFAGLTDHQGEHEPWLEIYNSSTNMVSLDGLFLTSSYTNLSNWAFPPGASIGPTQFLVVFCDAEAGETAGAEYHTSFRLTPTNGSVALTRFYTNGLAALNGPQVLDYVNYSSVDRDRSFGSFPDGQPFARQEFYHVTPRGTNDGRSATLAIWINEWMAANTSASGFADPADGHFEDWFELYNPGPNAVDLGGYFLTDNLTNQFQFQIPNNGRYAVAPGGYLLVWADREPNQNSTNRADLHVSFNLNAAGEAIGLFAADGAPVDAVTFGQQGGSISQGRSPDGGAGIIFQFPPSPRAANTAPASAPSVTGIVATITEVTLIFSTQIGRQYRLQFKNDLGAPDWIDLPGDVFAIETSATKADTNNGAQRFYRVQVLP